MNAHRIGAIVIAVLGIAVLAMGIIFVSLGVSKTDYLESAMREEKISLGLSEADIKAGKYVTTGDEAQKAADIIRSHRRAIAPTYDALLQGKRFDPTNLKQLTYAQALNLENYLYTAALAFGLVTVTTASGVVLIIAGIALVLIAVFLAFRRIHREMPPAGAP